MSLTLAFKLRDSFDDQVLNNINFSFYLNNKLIKPIKKNDGCYIIINNKDKNFELKILADNYFEKNILIDIDKIKDRYIEIYLVPDYKFKKTSSDLNIQGISDPNTEVWATKLSNRTNIRFISFEKIKKNNNNILKISNPASESLLGRLLAVVDLEKKDFQSFFIENKISDTDYEIDSEINKKYKISSPIQKAYVTKSDETGYYNFYLSNNNKLEDDEYIVLYYKNKKRVLKVIDFK